jgi:hypothetical protein
VRAFAQHRGSFWLKDIFMLEGRIAPRHRVSKRAKINYGGDKYPCTVRDISATGAALEFSDLTTQVILKAKTFTLEIPDDRLKLPCRIVWQRGYRMGVTFD